MVPYSILFLGAWGAALLLLERLFPAALAPRDTARLVRNVALGAIVFGASPIIQTATLAATGAFTPLFRLGNILLELLILDVWTYALHRAYHRVPLMWRLHSVHHFDEHLDVTSAVRFHLGEVIWSSFLRLIPLFLLGISVETNLIFGAILTASAMFHHSNLRLPPPLERALSWMIVTPSIHWVHHHAVRRDTDSNYAAILSVWDRLFGSFSPTQRTLNMAIGVEGERERTLPMLLMHPFTLK